MTKSSTIILTFFIILTACSNTTRDKKRLEIQTVDSIPHKDTTSKIDTISSVDKLSFPLNDLLEIALIFDSAGFTADTNRIKKVDYYSSTVKTSPVFLIRQIPFYKMDTAANRVFNFLKHGTYNLHYSAVDSVLQQGQLKIKLSRVTTVTGFYFTENNPSGFTTDGFIEKWEFSNPTEAESAMRMLTNRDGNSSPTYYFIYFNSFAHIFKKENYLYTYYSRSTWDAKLLDNLYEQIIKKISPESWTTSKGQTKRKNGA